MTALFGQGDRVAHGHSLESIERSESQRLHPNRGPDFVGTSNESELPENECYLEFVRAAATSSCEVSRGG